MSRFIYMLGMLLIGLLPNSLWAKCSSDRMSFLEKHLKELVRDKPMEVGIAAVFNNRDTVTVHNDRTYPLMSVFKLHQALAVLYTLSSNNIPLDTLVYVDKKELHNETYSPLREKYPMGNRNFSVRQLLEYTLLLSDNNACDILFSHIVNIPKTVNILKCWGLTDFAIEANEWQMHKDIHRCADNWSTPLSAVLLLEKMLRGDVVKGSYLKFLQDTMEKTNTGMNRLPSFSGKYTTRLGHKTGTGTLDSEGEFVVVNDVGYFCLPDGSEYTLAVFIKNSKVPVPETEALISSVSEMVYQFVVTDSGDCCE